MTRQAVPRSTVTRRLGPALTILALTLMALASFAAGASDAASNATVVGTWNLELMFQGEKQSIRLEIRDEDGKLAGTWVGPHRTNELEDFTWDGTTLTFVRNVERQGKPAALRHRATVDGDDMTGTITAPEGETPFTAKRAHGAH